jgi:hypothetical protein
MGLTSAPEEIILPGLVAKTILGGVLRIRNKTIRIGNSSEISWF